MTNYNQEPATYHNNGTIENVLIHDATPGKHGYIGIIRNGGKHEFVDEWLITYGPHNKATCEVCNAQ